MNQDFLELKALAERGNTPVHEIEGVTGEIESVEFEELDPDLSIGSEDLMNI